jgi:hypothetical protein
MKKDLHATHIRLGRKDISLSNNNHHKLNYQVFNGISSPDKKNNEKLATFLKKESF